MDMSVRQQKMGAQIRRLVSDLIARGDVADPRVEDALNGGTLISVTRVEMTPDLRDARVYVSILGKEKSPGVVLHGLQSATRYLQKTVARALPIRMAPRLEFRLDETLKKEAAMLKKIDDVVKADALTAKPKEPETPPGGPAA